MVHPFANNDLKPVILGAHYCDIYFRDTNTDFLRSSSCKSMDAAVQLYQHVARFRSKFKPDWRIHGVIRTVKDEPVPNYHNFISTPKSMHSGYMVRAVNQEDLFFLQKTLENLAEVAAKSTGCRLELRWEGDVVPCAGMIHNSVMAEVYREYSEEEGVVYPANVKPFYGSTDMENVSLVVPSIHPGFSLGKNVMIHTREFEELAGSLSEEAQKWTLVAAKAMALTCVRLFADGELREHVEKECLNWLKT